MTKKYIQDFKSKLATGGTVSPEELQDFFSRLEGDLKDKKYGLVWESQTEQVIEQLKTNKVYLEEEQDLKITQDPDNPKSNILIEGDNYEALTYLVEINQKVDVIYIDPPYNTGNKDFIYNDRFIDKEDGFRHSQWLSFMDARLRLARELMTDEGVIFISIDDNEMAQLKLLCDQIFGEENVETFIWNTKDLSEGAMTKTASNTVRKQHEYIITAYKTPGKKFSKYTGLAYENSKGFSNPDNDPRGDWMSGNISRFGVKDSGNKGSKYFTITNPKGKSFSRNWRISKKEYEQLEKDNRMWYGANGNGTPRIKIFKDEPKKIIQDSIFSDLKTSITGKKTLTNMGIEDFDYPKPVQLIKRLITISSDFNAIVLDFFAGSGTTGHAVLELNQEDGGNRQFILCTNNENNIAEEVTYERLKRVMNGYTTPKGKDVPGIPSNLTYYKTKQESKV